MKLNETEFPSMWKKKDSSNDVLYNSGKNVWFCLPQCHIKDFWVLCGFFQSQLVCWRIEKKKGLKIFLEDPTPDKIKFPGSKLIVLNYPIKWCAGKFQSIIFDLNKIKNKIVKEKKLIGISV